MRADLFFLLLFALPLLCVWLAIQFLWPVPRKRIVVRVLFVALAPLVMLSGYLVFEYHTWRWNIFPYGSLVPFALAAILFLIGLSLLLWKEAAPLLAKIALVVASTIGWAVLCFGTALFTACAMGDCL